MFDYFLFHVEYDKSYYKSEQFICRDIFDELKSLNCCKIYPTHDNLLYVGTCDDQSLSSLKNSLTRNSAAIQLNKHLKIQLVESKPSGFSEYGLFKLKSNFLAVFNLLSNDYEKLKHFFKRSFGVELVKFDLSTQCKYMIKADDYQKSLLDYLYERELKSRKRDENNNSFDAVSSPNKSPHVAKNATSSSSMPKLTLIQNLTSNITYKYECLMLEVFIKKGDLLEQRVECLVNPANNFLVLGGGVSGAIAEKCGRLVQTECDQYLRANSLKRLDNSHVMHTKSYNLAAHESSYIIHAVGPRWHDYSDKEKCARDLRKTFLNVLNYACDQLKCKSVAIPLISSGIFGVPRALCCESLFSALDEFAAAKKSSAKRINLNKILLVNIDAETNNDLLTFFRHNYLSMAPNKENKVHTELDSEQRAVVKKFESVNESNSCVRCKHASVMLKEHCNCAYCEDCYENMDQNGLECLNEHCPLMKS